MDELSRTKANFSKKIEDARKVDVFTSMPEFQWYVDHVLKPTIYQNTQDIMKGKFKTDKEDWIHRGIVQGIQMVIDGTIGIKLSGKRAKEEAKKLQEALEDE